VTLERLIEQALAARPEIASAQAAVAREESSVRLSERNRLPDFEFSLSRFENYQARNGFGAMASVTLPIVQRAKYDAAVSEAKAKLAAAQAELRLIQDRIRKEVEQALIRAQTALSQYRLFTSTHIPQAEQSLNVTQSSYQAGAVDFLSLLDTLRNVESVHVDHFDAQGNFERARADLERAIASDLGAAATQAPASPERHRHE
jgi:outer membrane protein TolC